MLEGRYASVTPRKYEIFPYFSQKHFEICPELCKFALEHSGSVPLCPELKQKNKINGYDYRHLHIDIGTAR